MNRPDSLSAANARPTAWVMLGFLCVAFILSMLDRMVLALLLEPIKADLGVSDLKMSFLYGFAFLITYAVAGIPIGVMVDRVNRIRLVALGIALWSLFTMLCGLSAGYALLFMARIGVGVGEATLSPSAYSLIGDSFPRRRMGLAFGLFSIGGVSGSGIAFIIGGATFAWAQALGPVELPVIGLLMPWQTTFLAVGLPGLLLAACIALLSEPERRDSGQTTRSSFAEYLNFARTRWRALLLHHAAVGCSNIACYGVGAWVGAYFMRLHGWPIGKIGALAGIANIVGGALGLIGGGLLGDRLARDRPHLRLAICAGAVTAGAALALGFARTSDPQLAVVLFGGILACGLLPLGTAGAALQVFTPPRIMGAVSAGYVFMISILGAFGPTLVAFLSETVLHGPNSFRNALAIVLPTALLTSAALFLAAIRYFRSPAEPQHHTTLNPAAESRAAGAGSAAASAHADPVRSIRGA